jgi:hypothetical protein
MNNTVTEITVTIKDEEKTLRSKYLTYVKYALDYDDPVIKDCVARSLKDFSGEPTDIRLRINLTIL